MSNDNVIQINPNATPSHALSDEVLEGFMQQWADGVATDDYLGVIAALNGYADALTAAGADGIVSIQAFLEMKGMLHDAMDNNSERVVYHPTKGWYDGGADGENIGA